MLLIVVVVPVCLIEAAEQDENGRPVRTVAPVGPRNPRNGEAAIIQRKDETLLLGWTEFYAGSGADHGPARISGKISEDGGYSWTEKFTLVENDGACKVMEVNFLRREDTIEAMKEAKVDVIHHPHGNYLGLGRNGEEWTRGKMVYFVPRATFARAYILINNSAGDTKHPRGVNEYGSGALAIDPLGQVIDRTTQQDRKEKMIVVTLRRPLSVLVPPYELRHLYGR